MKRCTMLWGLSILGALAAFPFTAALSAAPTTGPGTAASDDSDRKRTPEIAVEATRRRDRIQMELSRLRGHPWAGSYYAGDGLGVNTMLWLAPEGGFVFEWHGCLGLYDRNYGSAKAGDGLVRLQCELPNKREGFEGIEPDLHPIHWGQRIYLVADSEMLQFVNAINSGKEPRREIHGMFLMRDGDDQKPADAKPDLPAAQSALLLTKPLSCQISKTGNQIQIDAGRAEGVFVGMELYATDHKISAWFDVTDVAEHSAGLKPSFVHPENASLAGLKLSSRASWAR
ncbi:MAG TPA: hypothetical protein VH518_16250 [Tepidisphaeraceae bacterium]